MWVYEYFHRIKARSSAKLITWIKKKMLESVGIETKNNNNRICEILHTKLPWAFALFLLHSLSHTKLSKKAKFYKSKKKVCNKILISFYFYKKENNIIENAFEHNIDEKKVLFIRLMGVIRKYVISWRKCRLKQKKT